MIMKIVNKNKESEKGLFKILLLDLTKSKKNDQNEKKNAKEQQKENKKKT